MAVLAATALTTGTYDPQTLSAAKATIRTRNLVRTLAARHRADNTDTATLGGSGWQSALHGTGRPAVLREAGHTGQDHLAAMPAREADRLTTGNNVHSVGSSGHQLCMTRRDGPSSPLTTARRRRTTGERPRSPWLR